MNAVMPTHADSALSLRAVSKRFAGLTVLNDLNMDIRRGEIHGLIGPNGAGKTTAINIATGFYQPSSGAVLLDGADVTRTPSHRRAARGPRALVPGRTALRQSRRAHQHPHLRGAEAPLPRRAARQGCGAHGSRPVDARGTPHALFGNHRRTHALWRAQAGGDRAGLRLRLLRAAARRADGRAEPGRDRGACWRSSMLTAPISRS